MYSKIKNTFLISIIFGIGVHNVDPTYRRLNNGRNASLLNGQVNSRTDYPHEITLTDKDESNSKSEELKAKGRSLGRDDCMNACNICILCRVCKLCILQN